MNSLPHIVSSFHVWLALIGLYVLEGIRLTSPGAVVFRPRWLSGTWAAGRSFTYPGNGRWGWTLGPILPGDKTYIVAQDFLLAYGQDCFAPNLASTSSKQGAIAYSEIQSVGTNESFVVINGSKYIRCNSNPEAQHTADQIDRLRTLSPQAREAAIKEFLQGAFSGKVEETLQSFKIKTRILRVLVSALWITAFVLLPILLFVFANDFVLVPVGGVLWLLAAAIAVAAPMAERRVKANARRKFPWKSLKYVFYPVAALRAQEELAQGLFTGIHPMVLCRALCSKKEQVERGRDLLLRVRYPVLLCPAANEKVNEVNGWFHRVLAEQIEGYLARATPESLKSLAPEQLDPSCLSYCPRCRSQYRMANGVCSDCSGVVLQSLENPILSIKGSNKEIQKTMLG